MIVIHTQDEVYIKPTADAALPILTSVYGPKLAKEAYNTMDRKLAFRLSRTVEHDESEDRPHKQKASCIIQEDAQE